MDGVRYYCTPASGSVFRFHWLTKIMQLLSVSRVYAMTATAFRVRVQPFTPNVGVGCYGRLVLAPVDVRGKQKTQPLLIDKPALSIYKCLPSEQEYRHGHTCGFSGTTQSDCIG